MRLINQKQPKAMKNNKKHIGYFGSIIILFIILFSLNVSGQIVHNDKADPSIVHNDKTGIVLEIIVMKQDQNILKVQDTETGHIYQSKPTKVLPNKGDSVIFREMCHCTCVVMRSCK